MFLNRLSKGEQKAFLELAYYVAKSDNDFSELEKEIITQYCIEMQIDNIDFDKKLFDMDKTLSKIENKISQKIVLLEIMALIYSDNSLHLEEKKIINTITKKFGLKKALVTVYGEWAKSILALHTQGNALIEL